jgi:hypothetical protein
MYETSLAARVGTSERWSFGLFWFDSIQPETLLE